ncbi:bacteriophage CI repressor [Salmonella enterica subsp. enterica serovar Give]|nr:bacteriophage CI repressor [Salmonella enterica subsp. enterica serovar Give]ECM0137968.1 bacteriophage CI repressor [Salmonella enterica subsp. enterica serovar Give]
MNENQKEKLNKIQGDISMETLRAKNHRVSFTDGQKETFINRLRELVNGRPLQQAADVWNVPKSTLNNYFYRGSHPRMDVIQRIAHKEGVSVEWLLGKCDIKPTGEQMVSIETINEKKMNDDLQIISLLHMVSSEDKRALLKAIFEIGIKGILSRLQQADGQPEREYTTQELETMIMALPVRESLKTAFARGITAGEDADKEILRILESHQQGLSPEGSGNKTTTPAPSLKQKAG